MQPPNIRESLREYGEGLAGGLLFSLPLLYTMEVWWTGFIATPERLALAVLAAFLLLLGYNRFAGLRKGTELREIVVDSIEELGIGLVLAAFVLWMLGRITHDQPLSEVLGKVIVEAITVAIGVSVGTAQFTSNSGEDGEEEREEEREAQTTFGLVTLSACGAVLVGSNVAPTEEILMIAVETAPWRMFVIGAVSLGMAYAIVRYSEGKGHKHPHGPVHATLVVYAVALCCSAALLWFFGRLRDVSSGVAMAQVVVLAFPGTLGASAGRLLISR